MSEPTEQDVELVVHPVLLYGPPDAVPYITAYDVAPVEPVHENVISVPLLAWLDTAKFVGGAGLV